MRAVLVLVGLAACDGGAPLPGVSVEVQTRPGLRDLVAVTEGAVDTVTWMSDGGDEVAGDTVPADRLWPGETWTVIATGATGAQASATWTVPEPPGGNVIVVLLDDVGVDKVGAYGDPTAPPTPTLDKLADEGVRFTRAYASPVCSPTRGILLTGRHARRIGIGWVIDTGSGDRALSLKAHTLPEALAQARGEAGPSATGATGKWHLAGPLFADRSTHPMDSGFDWFSGIMGNPDAVGGYDSWTHNDNGEVAGRIGYLTTATIDDTIERIASMPEPWLMYVAPSAVHWPWTRPPEPLIEGTLAEDPPPEEAYNAVLRALDTELGRLLDTVDPDVLARTTVLVMGDNGTPDEAVNPVHDAEQAKATLYEGGINVPLIVTGPHVTAPGTTSDALVHVADLYPTVLQLTGVPLVGPDDALQVPLPDGTLRPLDGRSLVPQLSDPDAPGHDYVFSEAFIPNGQPLMGYSFDRVMVRDERWKLMRHGDLESFFDLSEATWENPDGLLLDGPLLTNEQISAYLRLSDELEAFEDEVRWEGF